MAKDESRSQRVFCVYPIIDHKDLTTWNTTGFVKNWIPCDGFPFIRVLYLNNVRGVVIGQDIALFVFFWLFFYRFLLFGF